MVFVNEVQFANRFEERTTITKLWCLLCLFVALKCEAGTIYFESVEISERAERDCFRVEISARDLLKLFESNPADLFDHFIR